MSTRSSALLLGALLLGACTMSETNSGEAASSAPLSYPPVHMGSVVDDLHGDRVPDPYRWMEDLDAPEVAAFVEAQNAVARPYLESLPGRDALIARLRTLWDYERFGMPVVRGERTFWTRNDGLQAQGVLWVREGEGEPRILLDPNQLSADKTSSLAGWRPSPDGSLLAWSESVGGSDINVWRIRDVATGEDLEDALGFTKFTSVSWTPDGRSFLYSRYPEKDGEGDYADSVRVHLHRVGTAQSEDQLIYEIPGQTQRNPYAGITDDGRWVILNVREGYRSNAVYAARFEGGGIGEVRPVFTEWDALYSFIGNQGDTLYFETTLDAPRGRIIAVTMGADGGRSDIQEVVPQVEPVLEDASMVGGRIVITYLDSARSRVFVHGLDGRLERELELPGLGTAGGFGGKIDQPFTHYAFSSFTAPPTIYRLDLDSGASSVWRRSELAYDADALETEQVHYESKDGTRVSMWIVRNRDLVRDGKRPVLLYGYGGFNISLTPGFSASRIAWLEMGGILAIPNLRGGGEYGDAWHAAGTKTRKQNVFDDFIAAAEWLIDSGWTAPEHLAIQGGSNGGLLVAACSVQRPELFAAALPAVGVLDMLRYHTASANARNWSSDYGLSENEDEYRALRAYSPVHNVRTGVAYPATLVTTGDHDDRVVPWHSYKYAAALQAGHAGEEPILLRVETRAGHGAGKPTWMRIQEVADQWAFLVRHLGMPVPGTD